MSSLYKVIIKAIWRPRRPHISTRIIPCRLCQDPESLSIISSLTHRPASPSSIGSRSGAGKYGAIIKHTDSCGSLYFQNKPEGELFSGANVSLMIRRWDFSSHTGRDYSRGGQRYGRERHKPENELRLVEGEITAECCVETVELENEKIQHLGLRLQMRTW